MHVYLKVIYYCESYHVINWHDNALLCEHNSNNNTNNDDDNKLLRKFKCIIGYARRHDYRETERRNIIGNINSAEIVT